MENLTKLKEEICNINLLIKTLKWQNHDYDDYLDYRDNPDFEDRWLIAKNDITTYTQKYKFDIDDINEIEQIAFNEVYDITLNCDLAAYVSDDFKLIAKNFISGQRNSFLNNMWDIYRSGELPR
ncbi:MAG: hypothetical protein N4A72_09190 [Bacteroidales bacterium]|jgi:hypothetical protein|nr:hypothetical protein [Bacteroidales bacterium]